MFVFFNLIGLAIGALALGTTYGLLAVFPTLNGPVFWVIAFGLLFALDLGYRFGSVRPKLQVAGAGLKTDLSSHWLTCRRGGSLMLLPAWLFALVMPLVGEALRRL